ncbi:MAG: hypothetical protein ABSH56_28740 [Bryobacteraceae bacterium]|jgi:hypothetical protein
MNRYDQIPSVLNSRAQARANSHDQHAPASTPAQPITPVPGASTRETVENALPYLTGAAELAATRQLNAENK